MAYRLKTMSGLLQDKNGSRFAIQAAGVEQDFLQSPSN
jgi:hypothetical protein